MTSSEYYHFAVSSTGNLLDGNGSAVYASPPNNGDYQRWTMTSTDGEWYVLTQKATGNVLDGNGSSAYMLPPNGGDYQLWKLQDAGNGWSYLQQKATGNVIDASGATLPDHVSTGIVMAPLSQKNASTQEWLQETDGKNLIVVISDVHIGNNTCTVWYQSSVHEPFLSSVLDWVIGGAANIKELVLLGDFVDFWTYADEDTPPTFADIVAANPNILGPNGKICAVLDALGGAVTYVIGNHDISVTQADVQSIVSPGGHALGYAGQGPYYPLAPDMRLALTHGNEFTMFNAPDSNTSWAPLPVGHFVTRTVATQMKKELAGTGKTVADLPGQGAPNGISLASFAKLIFEGKISTSIVETLLNFVSQQTGVSEDATINLANGDTTTLNDVKKIYGSLWTQWVTDNGGGEIGLLYAVKAAIADANGDYMGWFAQKLAFEADTELVVMGHTHTPIGGVKPSLIQYINSGFECPSIPDMPVQIPTFAVLDINAMRGHVWQIQNNAGVYQCSPYAADNTSVVFFGASDYSSYVMIDNRNNDYDLTLQKSEADYGYFVSSPPQTIAAGSVGQFWVQDKPGTAGSEAKAVYSTPNGDLKLHVQCPFLAIYSNDCSGASVFYTRSGNDDWGNPNHIAKSGHPFFVRFVV